MKFIAKSVGNKLGFSSEISKNKFLDDLFKNKGARYEIERIVPESRDQRNFFEGAVVPLFTFYQENLDHHDNADLRRARTWFMQEFNNEVVIINQRPQKIAKTSKGELQRGLLERIKDWMGDQGYQTEMLISDDYKIWRDTIFPQGGPDNYIDYLVEFKKLRIPLNK